ncbi:hypothetical protein VA7868_03722 [Vibrio aerogenes CECT 7868]|uniref:Uncharacterized protein n=1 Tax=Vibrio aerogenes CECT 7868 TaxID=1216006 RepID=A0A1M6B6I1_9VIBR|nr:hypothetical protein VA7868_03722 [Vibrio aerogenes CECT 7868]
MKMLALYLGLCGLFLLVYWIYNLYKDRDG